jgi:hypothetical protein
MSRKGSRKEVKYNSLCIEIDAVWNMKCVIASVIIGETGTVTKG